jgi:glutamine phosphoribosylpyrophosphate amidotransferase
MDDITHAIGSQKIMTRDCGEKPRESCGIFGIHGNSEAAKLTYFGLYALQHRGQESAGIAVMRDQALIAHKGMGLVPEVFDIARLEQLQGRSAIGHVRYSTTGSSVQCPTVCRSSQDQIICGCPQR